MMDSLAGMGKEAKKSVSEENFASFISVVAFVLFRVVVFITIFEFFMSLKLTGLLFSNN